MTNSRTALVLGASGGIGGEVARRLQRLGWTVRALHRNPDGLSADDKAAPFLWLKGDAMVKADVVRAAGGASVIVHAVNPPGYRKWNELALPMLDNTIAAARAGRARIVFPGNAYNFGPDAFPEIDETAPQHPCTVKGRVRVEMERRLRAAAEAGTPVLIVRAGDFFGPKSGNSWFSEGMVKPGKPVAGITYPGKRGIGHQWAYLPDVAETMVRLIERADALDPFAVFHMEGQWDADGTEMITAIRSASGNPRLKVRQFPWQFMRLLSPFVPLFRELVEVRHLWRSRVHMGNARLIKVLGEEPHTPLVEAVRETLAGMGCLPALDRAGSDAAAREGSPVRRTEPSFAAEHP